MKGSKVTKIIEEVKFEGVLKKLETKKQYLQRQSQTKYCRLTLVFIRNSTLREKFNFFFQEFFASIDKNFILSRGLGTRLSFYRV